MTERDDLVAAHLLQRHAPGPEGPCPADDLLAGYSEGRLRGERAVRVEEHLTRCDPCRSLVAGLRADADEAAAEAPPVHSLAAERSRRASWAIAAAVVLAVGAATWLAASRSRTTDGLEERLVAEASRLASERPDVFGGFAPLRREELAAATSDAPRGGLSVVLPAETVLSGWRAVEWTGSTVGSVHSVSLAGSDGKVAWSVDDLTGRSVSLPASVSLAPGASYVVEVTARGPLGSTTARRPFRVASEDAARRWESTRREIESRAAEDVRSLLLAHAAIRSGLYAEAESAAAAQVRRAPRDAFARETLASIRRVLGRPDEVPPATR